MLKFTGSLQDHWRKRVTTYGTDQSEKCVYHFNEYGFRETNYDPDKPITYICGCSHTFGTGLNYEDTWAYKLGRNHLNFSMGGACNAYITRTLIQQCEYKKPELVIAHFTHLDRVDYWFENAAFSVAPVGSWVIDPNHKTNKFREKTEEIKEWARTFFKCFRPLDSTYSTINQMLLLQYYCRSNNIPLVMMNIQVGTMNKELKNLFGMLDIKDYALNTFKCDKAHDDLHFGAKTNSFLANKLRNDIGWIDENRA